MTAREAAALLDAEIINLPDADRKLDCGYAGDFLSFVMGRAPADCVWFTVMNNVNVCAVATLADVSLVVLCEGVRPDAALAQKIGVQNVNLVVTALDVFSAVKTVAEKL